VAALLAVHGLRTEFDVPGGTVYAVEDVSFTVERGETLGVVGESGSGKSVTFLSIMGLLPARGARTFGHAVFDGVELVGAPAPVLRSMRGNRIAMVFQDPMSSLNPVLRIGSQIAEVLRLHRRMDRGAAHARAVELLALVNIPDAAGQARRYPHELSGGMRQRVMIAMGLACEPDILIADEPTTALDVTVQAQIVRLVQRLRDDTGMAVLWVTHDLALLAGFADRIQVMYAGRVVEDGSADEVYEDPRHPYTLGLLASMPAGYPDRSVQRLRTIPGAPPDPSHRPAGCAFADRCVLVESRCRTRIPPLTEIAPRRRVACWVRPDRARFDSACAGGGR
jgi:oligopeptide transport system ATP-binding protein